MRPPLYSTISWTDFYYYSEQPLEIFEQLNYSLL